jgi:hypothetical protein
MRRKTAKRRKLYLAIMTVGSLKNVEISHKGKEKSGPTLEYRIGMIRNWWTRASINW